MQKMKLPGAFAETSINKMYLICRLIANIHR